VPQLVNDTVFPMAIRQAKSRIRRRLEQELGEVLT
jgi:hypothetical protein